MAEIMFEKYKVAGLYFSLQPVLSLYAQGRTTGLVLDVGHHLMQAVPVYEGFALNHAIHRSHFGGADLTEFMKEMLRNVSRFSSYSPYRNYPNKLAQTRTRCLLPVYISTKSQSK